MKSFQPACFCTSQSTNAQQFINQFFSYSMRLFALLIAFSFTTKAFAQSATVSTNKSDYMPGETVIITGTGWQPGETVQLVLTETPLIHPPQTLTAVANNQGNIFNNQYIIEPHDLGQYFTLVATGLSSGLTASTFFTDANSSANLDQFSNDKVDAAPRTLSWVNGNLNESGSHYSESLSVPYRMVMENLSIGTHTLIIEWDIKNGGKHALDYITSYSNIDYPVGSHLATFGHSPETINPLFGLSGTFSVPNTFPIPAPSSAGSPVAGQPTNSFNALPAALRLMTIYNGTITALSYVSQESLTAAQSETRLSITFTASDPTVVIAWGGHIAAEADWGLGQGATGVSGSPYHTRLISLDGSGGNQDRSLKATAVVIAPRIEIAGPLKACPETNSLVYTGTLLNPNNQTATYTWSLINNTAGAVISGSSTGTLAANTSVIPPLAVIPSGTDFIPGGTFNVQLVITRGFSTDIAYLGSDVSPGNNVVISNLQVTATASPAVLLNIELVNITQLTATASGGTPPYTYSWSANLPGSSLSSHSISNPILTVTVGGTYTYTVTVTDNFGCVKTASVTVIASSGAPPDCEVTGPTPVCPGTTNIYTGSSPGGFSNTWTLINNTSGATISGSNTGASVSIIAGSGCDKNYTVHLRSVSPSGAVILNCEIVVSVDDNTAPTISALPAPSSVECPATPSFATPTATDACDASVTLTFADVTTPGACPQEYSVTRTWTATDDCGNSTTASQTISVTDNTAPVLVGTISNKTIDCEIPVVFANPTFTDDCSGVTVTYADVITGYACPSPILKAHTRTWTATDACGNSTTVSQTITVKCCPTICTYTQGFYGNKNGKACTPAGPQVTSLSIMQAAMAAAGGSKDFGIVSANNRYFKLVNADFSAGTNSNIYKMLPGGGTPLSIGAGTVYTSYGNTSTWSRIPIQTTNPGIGSINNTLLSQTMALFFNLNMDNTLGNFQLLATGIITSPKASCGSTYPLATKDTFYIPQNVLDYLTSTNGATVTGLYNLANQYLGGFTVNGMTIGDVNQAVDAINRAFDKCRAFRDYYTPPVTNLRMIVTSNPTNGEPKQSAEPKQTEPVIPAVLKLKVTAYPNPFNSVVNFRIVSPESGQANLELFDMVGRRLAIVYSGRIDANSPRTITYTMPVVHQSLIVYKFTIGGKTVVGNLISSDGNSINKP